MHSRAVLRPQRTVCVSELTMLPAWNFLRRNSHYTGFAAAMAPVYGVDHSLSDQDAATDASYKDYGPLFRALRATRWILDRSVVIRLDPPASAAGPKHNVFAALDPRAAPAPYTVVLTGANHSVDTVLVTLKLPFGNN